MKSRSGGELLFVFLLTPVWWILGFNIFIYQAIAGFVFMKLMMDLIYSQESLKITHQVLGFGFFLFAYAASVILNFSENPFSRVLSSVNHFLILLMGFLLLITAYHLESPLFFRRFFRTCWILSGITGVLAVLFLLLWHFGYRSVTFPSLIGRLFPGLMDYPFFYLFSVVQLTSTDWLVMELPRLSIYSVVHTATGGFMITTLPLGLGYLKLNDGHIWGWKTVPFIAAAMIALFFSLSRTAICVYAAATAFVWLLGKRDKFIWALFGLLLVFFASGKIYDLLVWLLNVRYDSTVGRLGIYADAVKIVMEQNFLMGIGIRPREEFTMMAVGSHSTYIGLLLVSGFLGLVLFMYFQMSTFLHWLSQKKQIHNETQKIIWDALGTSYIGASLWFFTDTLDTFPFIAFEYFLVAGCILYFGRTLKDREPDSKFSELKASHA